MAVLYCELHEIHFSMDAYCFYCRKMKEGKEARMPTGKLRWTRTIVVEGSASWVNKTKSSSLLKRSPMHLDEEGMTEYTSTSGKVYCTTDVMEEIE
jgi:hypothetical protein